MINIKNNESQQRFEASMDGRLAGVCAYELNGAVVTFTHTEVQLEFEGEGVGSALANFVLEDSRAHKHKVIPACQFIRAYINKNPEFADLLA